MANTGRKAYGTLVQIYADTGEATGETKTNDPSDPDYIPPVVDTDMCPITTPPPVKKNKLKIEFVNNTSQAIGLSQIVVNPSGSSARYYHNENQGLLPGQSVGPNDQDQLSELTDVIFKIVSLALNRDAICYIKYKTSDAASFITLQTINNIRTSALNIIVDEDFLNTPYVVISDAINTLRIEFVNAGVVSPRPAIILVNAGPDREVSGDSFQLSAISDCTIFQWEQIAGSSTLTIESPDQKVTQVTGATLGEYEFKITATNDLGSSSNDTVKVSVISSDI